MQTTLYYRQGTSDKVYVIEKAMEGSGFVVKFGYGRRGASLKYGLKTQIPVDEATADKIFSSVFKKQVGEGYTDDPSGTPYAPCSFDINNPRPAAAKSGFTALTAAAEPTGINVQLLNSIEEHQLPLLLQSDAVGMQEKHDGKRLVLVMKAGEVYAVNRLGLRTGSHIVYETALKTIAVLCQKFFGTEIFQLVIDGESIGEKYYAFDLLELNDVDFRSEPYLKRWERLKTIVYAGNIKPATANIQLSDLKRSETAKRQLFEAVENARGEGVVFKDLNAPYESGRPSSGGTQLKYKFWEAATCLVAGQNDDKRSVKLQVVDKQGNLRDVGNCTIPVNFNIPLKGALVEVRYLYAYPDGALYQPIYQGERSDKQTPDSHASLKFKAEYAECD